RVQGSRPQPYNVTIQTHTLSDSDWRKVLRQLGEQPLFTAKLLAGEMPQDIEPVFTAAGLSLFPAKRNDLKTNCSCPDSSNPCKHLASVFSWPGGGVRRHSFLVPPRRGAPRR